MHKIVVIGSSNSDMVIKSDRLPVPGEIVTGGEFTMFSGGKGANQSIAIARMGGKVLFITKMGNDLFGRQSLELYKWEGIVTDYISWDPDKPSGVALVLMDAMGEKSISVARGANWSLSVKDIENARMEIENASILLMQLEVPMETVEYAAKIASEKGVRVIINPSPAQAISKKILQQTSIMIPNRIESELLTGYRVTDWISARKAAKRIHEKGVKTVIITLGSKGVLVYEDGIFHEIAAEKVNAIDTVAAGDTFCGTFCAGLSEGMSVVDAARIACKASAITVTRIGVQTSIPYRKELKLMEN
jgi:ribokinase